MMRKIIKKLLYAFCKSVNHHCQNLKSVVHAYFLGFSLNTRIFAKFQAPRSYSIPKIKKKVNSKFLL